MSNGHSNSGQNLPRRMWVNQPSTLQPHHKLHGVNVLVIDDLMSDGTDVGMRRVYFLSGLVVSIQITAECLSDGWRS